MGSRPTLITAATATALALGFWVGRSVTSPGAYAEGPAPGAGEAPAAKGAAPEEATAAEFREKIAPFLKQYCSACHGERRQRGGVDFSVYTGLEHALKDRATWERVREQLLAGVMPPKNKPQPPQPQRTFVADWVEAQLARVDCGKPVNPGRVTARRLNRAEYNNTIRDLFGKDFRLADDFPSDDVGYGFDNIGDVLSMPPILLEKYMAAAEKVVNEAIVLPEEVPVSRQRFQPQNLRIFPRSARSDDGRQINFTRNGTASMRFTFPAEGDYVFRVRAWGDPAGDEPPRMELRIDRELIKAFAVESRNRRGETYEVKARVKEGAQTVSVAYTNDFSDPDAEDPERRDRNLYVRSLEIEGPFDAKPKPPPETHRRVIFVRPTGPEDEDAAARKILAEFARRAYRRPVKPEEIDRLMKLVELAKSEGEPFEARIRLALRAVLVSPHFLFRVEPDPEDPNGVRELNDFELATRLSYFLWSSMPDEELFRLAEKGELGKPEVLEAQVRRMLADPKAEALVENFVGQWLNLRLLGTVSPDRKTYPAFDEKLRAAMQRETELFVGRIIREDRSLLEVLDADYTYVNERLAKHYGIEGVKGEEFRLVRLPDDRRGGVITQASVLTLTSNPTRTSPVKRGKWVLENLLGTPPPPPPPDAGELSETKEEILKGSLRERLEQHRRDPTCAVCHQRMDPIGFGLENFDGIGAWRGKDGNFAIDPSGELPDGSRFDGPAGLRAVLKKRADEFRRCTAEKLLTYALGRGLEHYDRCAVEEIVASMKKGGDRFSALALAVVKSDPFRKRSGKREE